MYKGVGGEKPNVATRSQTLAKLSAQTLSNAASAFWMSDHYFMGSAPKDPDFMFGMLDECLMKDIHPDTVLKSLYSIRTEPIGSKYRDPKKAWEILQKIAERPDFDGLFTSVELQKAKHYLAGLGVVQDVPKAVGMLEKLAKSSNKTDAIDACYLLCFAYEKGYGVKADPKKRDEWAKRAFALGGIFDTCGRIDFFYGYTVPRYPEWVRAMDAEYREYLSK